MMDEIKALTAAARRRIIARRFATVASPLVVRRMTSAISASGIPVFFRQSKSESARRFSSV